MNHQSRYRSLLLVVSLLSSPVAFSAQFCANSSVQLQSALTTAASNGQADDIRVRRGTFEVPAGGFVYDGNDPSNLVISGGWNGLVNSCTSFEIRPLETTLDGMSSATVLRINPFPGANYTISNMTLINGVGGTRSGGLHITPIAAFTGDVTVEYSGFINNSSTSRGTALSIVDGDTLRIRNNLFLANSGREAVEVIQSSALNSNGIYFTNNTVFGNSGATRSGVRLTTTDVGNLFVANNLIWSDSNGRDLDLDDQSTGTSWLLNNNYNANQSVHNANMVSGNFSTPPSFAPGLLNFTPASDSPLIDGGIEPPSSSPIPIPFEDAWGIGTFDFDGEDRLTGLTVDIGAFEGVTDALFMDGFE